MQHEVTTLFEEWLSAREAGRSLDEAELLRRAGTGAEALQKRIRVYAALVDHGGPEPDERVPDRRLGRFQLVRTLGSGGLGSVHLALDPELKREVALKVLHPGAEEGRGWILNEARTLARILHPGVVRVYEVLRAGPSQVVVMEYLRGPSLEQVLGELRRLKRDDEEEEDQVEPTAESQPGGADPAAAATLRGTAELLEPLSARVRVLHALAAALAHCHDREVLHRDVKPANVVFDEKGHPRLIDFGLAHHGGTRDEDTSLAITESLIASPAYMAPEQVESERTGADPRTDQFSFGVLAYEFLTLQHPFARPGRAHTMDAIARAEPLPPRRHAPAIPTDLERVLLHLLERRPEHRYPSMADVSADLAAVLQRRPISLPGRGVLERARRWARRHEGAVKVAAVGLGGSLLALVASGAHRVAEARTSLRSELDDVRARVLARPEPQPLFEAALRLFELRDELPSAVLPLWGGDLVDEAEALERTIASRVAAGVQAVAPPTPLGRWVEPSTRSAREDYLLLEWLDVVDLLEGSFPRAALDPVVAGASRIDVVALPPGASLHVFELVPVGDPHSFARIAQRLEPRGAVARPLPGRYRYVARDDASGRVVAEVGVQVWSPWRPRLELTLRAPDPAATAGASLVPRTSVLCVPGLPPVGADPASRGSGAPVLVTPAFRVQPRHVSRGAFERFAAEAGAAPTFEALYPSDYGADEPAWVSPAEAVAYAAAVGGRLPTALELELAERAGVLRLAPVERAPATAREADPDGALFETLGACAEWVEHAAYTTTLARAQLLGLSTAPGEARLTDVQDADPVGDGRVYIRDLPSAHGPRSVRSGVAFRLVFPADLLEAYAADEPRAEAP